MDDAQRRDSFLSAHLNRRALLKSLGIVGAAIAANGAGGLLDAIAREETKSEKAPASQATGDVPTRPLGRTGLTVSALCLGGAHLGRIADDTEAIRLLHEAIDAGITFMDNAWEYNGGRSEELMGRGLQGRRQQVVLMTKVCSHGRDKKVAMQQLEDSLRRLKTDYVDLWQIHEVIYDRDPDRHFASGGATEALLEAKRQGKVRFVGFTGHKDPRIHLNMLAHDFPFDTCQMPLNVFDGSYRSFEQEVLPIVSRRGIAAIGMKSLSGNGEPVKRGVLTAEEALRYVLSLPVATVVTGIDSPHVLRQNLDIARRFTPMTASDMDTLRQRFALYAKDGRFELYKSSDRFDGQIGRAQQGLA